MNPKSITRSVLLAVVAFAIGAWAVKEFGPGKSPRSSGGANAAGAASHPAPAPAAFPDGVTVINFHGDKRCKTCLKIGELAKQTIEGHFPAAVQAGNLHWQSLNFDVPANAHFIKDYALVSSTVVATKWKDGKEVTWKRLDGVWDHVGDETAFRAYVADNVSGLLEQP